MGKSFALALIAALFLQALPAAGGDEDKKQPPRVEEPREPEPLPLPDEPEAPELGLPGEEPISSPEFSAPEEPLPAGPRRAAKRPPWDPDRNIDYSEILNNVDPGNASKAVLPPALGARGYRPNLIAVGVGDRTPGYGALVEYSWNRVGAGVFFSYRPLSSNDRFNESQAFGGLYFLYRWLPFSISPYILAGVELGSETPESFGGHTGLGMEVRVYNGWTLLLGYTYHSTARKGFLGGAFGWTF